jgi:hypothetical protein
MGGEADIVPVVPAVGVDHAAGHHEQRDGNRNFQDHERVPPPLPQVVGRSDRPHRVAVQTTRLEQRRADAGRHAGEQRDANRFDQDAQLE